jgi:2-methylcitrate dehydratase PrpD
VIRDLLRKVELSVDPELDAAFPGRRAARVTVTTRDGRQFAHDAPTRKGDPDNPLTDEEISGKFRELADGAIGAAASQRLLETLWRIDRLPELSALAI